MKLQLLQTLVQLMVTTLGSDQNFELESCRGVKFVLLSELGKVEN